MPRTNSQGFNKEKLVFLGAAGLFAGGMYYFLISAPVALPDDPKPISTKVTAPAPLNVPNLDQRSLAYYVEDGEDSQQIDPLTGKLVNRKRKTPFMPEAGFTQALAGKNKPGGTGKNRTGQLLPPAPPPPPEIKKSEKDTGKNKPIVLGPHDPRALVAFMGVVIINGETYGLLRPKDGTDPLRVKVGDEIPDIKYKITQIEKQSIWVKDSKDCAFILRDTDEVPEADAKKGASDEDTADAIDNAAPDKEPKKAPTPAPKNAKNAKPAAPAADKAAADQGAGNAPPARPKNQPHNKGKRPQPKDQQP